MSWYPPVIYDEANQFFINTCFFLFLENFLRREYTVLIELGNPA